MGGRTALEHLDAVDAFARTLFLRAKQSSAPGIVDVATAVRQLHVALRHVRVESADPDSLLRSADASIYARQLRPIVEDCDFALKQLETILERYDDGSDRTAMAERAEAVRARLASEKTTIDMFLDTVQLHSRENNAPETVVGGNPENLEGIKDKVDEIAKGLFNRPGAGEDEEGMWQEFKTELEKAGFSSHVLRQHKVYRLYFFRAMH